MFTFLLTPWILLALPVLYWVVPYLTASHLRSIPGPFAAKFSNLWLLYQARLARRSIAVDEAHKQYGTLVRIAPNHVSIASDSAITEVYGHGNGFLKSSFYDAFVSIHHGMFNVRDRAQHSRKRKIVSNTFSAKSIGQFEPYMHSNLELFVKKWDEMAGNATFGGKPGFVKMDVLNWFNYLAFDVIGDLAFGAPFGMIEKGADIAEIRMTADAKPTYAPAIEVLNRRGEVSAAVGCFPEMKPYAKHLPDPFFSQGMKAIENLAGMAVARVKTRLEFGNPDGRVDLLQRLIEGKDETGQPLGRQELTAEALTQLIAGSDTTSNTNTALLYHVCKNPAIVKKLQQELDEAIPDVDSLPSFDQVKGLPYMDMVIKETLRIHSTSSMGLPRQVPPGNGAVIMGHHFPAGSVVSVPAYTIHHSKEIWGQDADEFNPDRWSKLTERQKNAFIPFSYGPRACVGRNVAEMELALTIATVFRRYEFELYQDKLETREGFLRKPVECWIGMKRRS